MIINHIHLIGMSVFKAEYDSPVCSYRNRPKALQLSFQGMQPESGGIHVFNDVCHLQPKQNTPDFIDIISGQFPPIVVFKQEAQSFVPETLNHMKQRTLTIVACQLNVGVREQYSLIYR